MWTRAAASLRLAGGGANAVVPKGAPVKQPFPLQDVFTGTVNGSCVVTLNGPLMPRPALVESSVKYSPRSANIPKPPRTTTFFTCDGLHAKPIRGANIHWRPVNVESLTPLKPNALLFPATTRPIPGSPLGRLLKVSQFGAGDAVAHVPVNL